MASALNRTTKEFRLSVNTPDYPVGDWIINPDMSAIIGFAPIYWIITGDVVTLQDAAARAATDAVLAALRLLTTQVESQAPLAIGPDEIGMRLRAVVELFNKRDNFNTTRIVELQNRVQAMLDSTGNADAMRTDGLAVSISATNTRTRPAAVADFKAIIDNAEVDGGS